MTNPELFSVTSHDHSKDKHLNLISGILIALNAKIVQDIIYFFLNQRYMANSYDKTCIFRILSMTEVNKSESEVTTSTKLEEMLT